MHVRCLPRCMPRVLDQTVSAPGRDARLGPCVTLAPATTPRRSKDDSSACKNQKMANLDWPEEERVERAIQEALRLGWSLHVDEDAGQWRAWGAPLIHGTGVFGRDLPGGVSQAEVAQAGMADQAGMAAQKSAQASGRNFATGASRADAAEAGLAAIQQLVRGGGSGR
jgi:hypothetical protein